MRNHTLNPVEIGVGCGVGIGQNVFRVEDVEALVFHRAHVEVADRNDVEHVEIVFAAECLLVPLHRFDQRAHCVAGAVEIAFADIDRQFDFAARHGGETVVIGDQIARHKREQIGWLGPWIVPFGPVRAILAAALCDLVAIGKQHGKRCLRSGHPYRIGRQDIGPVGEESDPAETLCLALGAQHPARRVKPHQLRIG